MYRGQHLLVIPRRYGGLCLPALEAAAAGLAVLMPDCLPNEELASLLMDVRTTSTIAVAAGNISTAEVNHVDLGQRLDELARHRMAVLHAQIRSQDTVPRWSEWGPKYIQAFERLLQS
jgi:glycosyltransferase involved in cell wall biosynthesis